MADLQKLNNDDEIKVTEEQTIKRFTFSSLSKQVFQFFNLEKGFLHTLKLLILNPGKNIRAYLSIYRNQLVNPFKFYFVSASLYVFVFLKFIQPHVNVDDIPADQEAEFAKIFFEYLNFWIVLFVFFISLFSYLFFKKKSAYNLVENLIMNFYIMGVILLFYVLLSPLVIGFQPYGDLISNTFMLVYFIYAYFSFFKEKLLRMFFKTFFSILLGVTSMLLIIVIIGVVYGIFSALT